MLRRKNCLLNITHLKIAIIYKFQCWTKAFRTKSTRQRSKIANFIDICEQSLIFIVAYHGFIDKQSHKNVETKTTDAKNTLGIAITKCAFKIMQKAFADFFNTELPTKFKTCAVDNFVTSKLFGYDLGKDQRSKKPPMRVK